MDRITEPSRSTWRPLTTADTSSSGYWLNWRVLLCSIWIFSSIVVAALLIWKYEVPNHRRTEFPPGKSHSQSDDGTWRTCLKEIHPAWLLSYRIFAFVILLTLLILNIAVDGTGIFYYYTQWTFTLITLYFAIGSLLSAYGCHQLLSKVGSDSPVEMRMDVEHGSYIAPAHGENSNAPNMGKSSIQREEHHLVHGENGDVRNMEKRATPQEEHIYHSAGIWGCIFQIIYQICAGAVVLTDVVFWLIFFPFLTVKDYKISFLLVGTHSINMVFLLGDAGLNCLRFPWFRFAYFILWTAVYVIFLWVIHAFISLWWPYPFLDLSSPHAPAWYLVVTVLHIPCYAIFAAVIKLKHALLAKWLPRSYQCM